MKKGMVNILIDGQWGSTGKGKLAGYLAKRHDIGVAAAVTSPNAGHTFIDDDGSELMLKQLPTGVLNQDATVVLTPHCVIRPERLLKEIEMTGCANRIKIHPHAAVVMDSHIKEEQEKLNRISSTLQGTGTALASRIMREERAVAKNVPELKPFISDTSEVCAQCLSTGKPILLEISQGFDLSLTWGFDYPYVTSRDITTASGMNAIGVSPFLLGDVYGSIRTLPIRVGHAYQDNDPAKEKLGDSGPFYPDQEELSWDEVTNMAKSPIPLLERTTVTQKVRRIFTMSLKQLQKFVRICAPTKIFLNHVNYWDNDIYGARVWDDLSDTVQFKARHLQNAIQDFAMGTIGTPVPRITLLGTGPKDSDMVEMEN